MVVTKDTKMNWTWVLTLRSSPEKETDTMLGKGLRENEDSSRPSAVLGQDCPGGNLESGLER